MTRYFYNTVTKVAHVSTPLLEKYQHKRTLSDLRLMPDGWKPGDKVQLTDDKPGQDIDSLTAAVLAKLNGANATAENVAELVAEQLKPHADPIETMDSGKLQEIMALIGEMDPHNKDQYTAAGKPDAKVLSSLLGRNVSAAERDEAYETFLQLQV